jgi:hypothetical protein
MDHRTKQLLNRAREDWISRDEWEDRRRRLSMVTDKAAVELRRQNLVLWNQRTVLVIGGQMKQPLNHMRKGLIVSCRRRFWMVKCHSDGCEEAESLDAHLSAELPAKFQRKSVGHRSQSQTGLSLKK